LQAGLCLFWYVILQWPSYLGQISLRCNCFIIIEFRKKILNFFETAYMCTYGKILILEKMKLILVVLFTQTLHFY